MMKESTERKLSLLVVVATVVMLYTLASAMCTIDNTECTFANGDWYNWLRHLLSRR